MAKNWKVVAQMWYFLKRRLIFVVVAASSYRPKEEGDVGQNLEKVEESFTFLGEYKAFSCLCYLVNVYYFWRRMLKPKILTKFFTKTKFWELHLKFENEGV